MSKLYYPNYFDSATIILDNATNATMIDLDYQLYPDPSHPFNSTSVDFYFDDAGGYESKEGQVFDYDIDSFIEERKKDAFAVAKNSPLRVNVYAENAAELLGEKSLTDIKILAGFSGLSKAGKKEELISRILRFYKTRREISQLSEEDINSKTKDEIKQLLTDMGVKTGSYMKKDFLVRRLSDFPDSSSKQQQHELAQSNFVKQAVNHVKLGGVLGDNAKNQLKNFRVSENDVKLNVMYQKGEINEQQFQDLQSEYEKNKLEQEIADRHERFKPIKDGGVYKFPSGSGFWLGKDNAEKALNEYFNSNDYEVFEQEPKRFVIREKQDLGNSITLTIASLKNQFQTANGMGKIALAKQILQLRNQSKNKAINLSDYYFVTSKGVQGFAGSKAYGIINPNGLALSADGESPMTAPTMASAKEQAKYADGFKGYSWVKIYNSIEEARAGKNNATNPNDVLESNRTETGNENQRVQNSLFNDRGTDSGSTGRTGRQAGTVGGGQQSDTGLPTPSTAASGTAIDSSMDKRNGELGLTAGGSDYSGSTESSRFGIHDDRATNPAIEADVREIKELIRAEKARLQREAESLDSVFNDEDSIRADLPFLLPEQQDDIVKIEKRLADANGMMITNGTGTGKTFVALGAIKRFAKQGKNSILIVCPSDKIMQDFVDSAKNLHLEIRKLENIQDNGGKGIAITSYANFYQNESLMRREWDLVVFDEAHKLNSNQAGNNTDAQVMMRKITNHKGENWSKLAWLKEDNPEIQAKFDSFDVRWKELTKSYDESGERYPDSLWSDYLEPLKEEKKAYTESLVGKKSRVLFLSATPFAYEKSLDYAEGYLFDYGEGGDGYNSGGGYERFMMQHFGYTMRYNKLTQPDSNVNSGAMQRQFNQYLKEQGALSGRALKVEADYSREFIVLRDKIGERIDAGFAALDQRDFDDLRYYINVSSFDYLSKLKLLEAIKAKALVSRIKKHQVLGRKVVLFHGYKVGGAGNPFKLDKSHKKWQEMKSQKWHGTELSRADKIAHQYELFSAKYPQFTTLNLDDLESPINTFKKAFGGDLMIYNGDIPKKQILQHANDFNDDAKSKDIILMQVDKGKEGVSLHDTTGKKTRVLINLGLPTKPTDSIQIEGRIYRTGQVSNAIFEYISTGTQFEKRVFSEIIAERSATAENLALGNEARDLLSAFTEGYLNAADSEPSKEQGTGGKQYAANAEISPFEKAKSDYFATQKANKYTKAKGVDYFPTPEPIGLKMVELANIGAGESALEPSAGHGAIARYFPEHAKNTFIEPSTELTGDLSLRVAGNGDIKNTTFEDLNVMNKFNAIVMNPPFGSGGKTAIEHLAKATKHLRDGGRVVALLPNGGMANKRLATFLNEARKNDIYMVAEIFLPSVAFERSGTSVASQIVVLDKILDEEQADNVSPRHFDFRAIDDIKELFEDMHNSLSALPRPMTLAEADKIREATRPKTKEEVLGELYDEFAIKNKDIIDSSVLKHNIYFYIKHHSGASFEDKSISKLKQDYNLYHIRKDRLESFTSDLNEFIINYRAESKRLS